MTWSWVISMTDDAKSTRPNQQDSLTIEELTELLADATDADPEEIEQAAESIDSAPPEDAEVVNAE